jgi:trehalose 6-phosphate phosphatase
LVIAQPCKSTKSLATQVFANQPSLRQPTKSSPTNQVFTMAPRTVSPQELDVIFDAKWQSWLYAFDCDGTLVRSASSDAAKKRLPYAVVRNMIRLNNGIDGFVSIVTGRTIENTDLETPGVLFPLGCCDGRVVRKFSGQIVEYDMPDVTQFRNAAKEFVKGCKKEGDPPMGIVELGGGSFGLQFARTHPSRDAAEAVLRSIEERRMGEVRVYRHSSEVVVASGRNDKGTAIIDIIESIKDTTGIHEFKSAAFGNAQNDDPAFELVNARGGISVVIGDYASRRANYRLASVRDMHKFIDIRANKITGAPTPRRGDGGSGTSGESRRDRNRSVADTGGRSARNVARNS